MPGKGRIVERDFTPAEEEAISRLALQLQPRFFANGVAQNDLKRLLGEPTCDIYLNNVAYWKNVPRSVWAFTIGGYQVIKKWLSYRERELLGRSLTIEEARTVTAIARRIAAIILMGPALDANYAAIKPDPYAWPR